MEFELKSSGIDNSVYLHDEAHSDKNEEAHNNVGEQRNANEEPANCENNRSNTMTKSSSYRYTNDANMSEENVDEVNSSDQKKPLTQTSSTMSKSGSYRYTNDKGISNEVEENDKEQQSNKCDDILSPGSYRYANDEGSISFLKADSSLQSSYRTNSDEDMKKSKHGSDKNMLSSHTYGYDNNAQNDESQIRRNDSSQEQHRNWCNNDDDDFIVKRKRSGNVSYETIVWVVFFVCNVVILIDRFTGNGDRVFSRKSRFLYKMY